MENKYKNLLKKETDRLIELESRDIKPNQKIKVSYNITKLGLMINVRKVKK